MTRPLLQTGNARAASLKDVPLYDIGTFRETVLENDREGGRIVSFFGCVPEGEGQVRLFAVLSRHREGVFFILSSDVKGSYRSLTPDCPQAHLFEREIYEEWGIVPEGHPWLKPVRFAPRRRKDGPEIEAGIMDFFRMKGEEAHEVAVGPVHAGVIEPGHFRFQCHGEDVFNLEISLGYQHRGVERAMVEYPGKRRIHYAETLAGDTTIGHATAYCHAVEGLSGCNVPARAQALRGVMLELERLANHAGDLGALSGDVAYLPTSSYCGRIRGDILNITALVCGSRFGRGMLTCGGVRFDVDDVMRQELLERLDRVMSDLKCAADLLWETPSVVDRFEGTGVVDKKMCEELGLVGPAARACGIPRDVRSDLPSGIYRFSQIPVFTCESGDVFARAYVRWMETQKSADFIKEQTEGLPSGAVIAGEGTRLLPGSIVVSAVEGWRGEICHVAMTGVDGELARYKVVDPSFHNWMGLAVAMRGGEISDFPLCNKSFNLSYCGHDL
ncbi:MAG: NADH-quinone oxidoreductase subunit C [Candidatus Omnitrophica bacterium]|nr:NADH-quinone oxidoreductase subunit C [Candidatus Omnitrophota bacterium]